MRRAVLFVVLAALAVAVLVTRADDPGRYRVAAIFDTAKGMVPGQLVKIAGAEVGTIEAVDLTPQRTARITFTVDRRFAPFRADARCEILPEGLISENHVQCAPGTPGRPELDGPVPLERTAVPVSLQDFINVLRVPANQRLRVLFNELGLATAGRGTDLDALLRRANPALGQARRLLAIIETQRRDVVAAVRETDAVLAAIAGRTRDVRAFASRARAAAAVAAQDVRAFVRSAATTAEATAAHRDALGEAVRRLPPMLRAVRPGLASLSRAMDAATPLLERLPAAGAPLEALGATLPAFARAGTPALTSLADAADAARPALRPLRPVAGHLRRAAAPLVPVARDLADLLVSTRDAGGIEGALRVGYTFGTNGSLYDETSHILAFNVNGAPDCIAADQAGVDVPQCNHKYASDGAGQIPVNAPACGPQGSAQLWNNARCGTTFRRFGRAPRPLRLPSRPSTPDTPPVRRPRRPPAAVPDAPAAPPAAAATPEPLPLLGGVLEAATPLTDLLDFLLK